MGYLGSYRGDYLRSYRGDPGLFGFIGKAIRKVSGIAGRVLPGPLGIPARAVHAVMPGGRPSRPVTRFPVRPAPGVRAMIERAVPGGRTGLEVAVEGKRPRRRINPANPKALRRAIRRQAGFVKLAKRALKGTGYTIVSRGSRRTAKRISVRESGPGGVQIG